MRLLVVEDELRMAKLLKRGFEEEGYAVDVVGDGAEAFQQGREVDYDAMVLDAMLPGCDGFEVCRRLRAAGRWTPILLVTARDGVSDRVRGLDAGADDYVIKPFSFEELAARVRALIRRGTGEHPSVLEVGTMRLDPARREAWREGSALSLTPKEFALLEYVMRRAGQVVTRTMILEHVWDFADDVASNVVDQYIAYLRNKVDRPFGRCDIETVRGIGYRLRAGDQR
jgi:two-component system, OmpR family, response regulator